MANKLQGLSKWFLNNWELKILAFVLALLSFFAIQNEISFEVTYNIPIEVHVTQPGVAILDQDPLTADVTFRGSQDDLRRLNQREIKAVVRLSVSNPAGSESVHVDPDSIEGISGVRVVKVHPSVVMVTFDHEATKLVRVNKPRIIGTPLIGKVEVDCEPNEVLIRGPRRRLAKVEAVSTEPIDVDGRVESFTKQLRVLSASDAWITEITPPEVSVKVRIVSTAINRMWQDVTVLAVMAPGATTDVSFEPAKVTVTLSGRSEVLEGIARDAIRVFVDCEKLDSSSTYELPVNVHMPSGVDVTASVEPRTVKVSIGGQR